MSILTHSYILFHFPLVYQSHSLKEGALIFVQLDVGLPVICPVGVPVHASAAHICILWQMKLPSGANLPQLGLIPEE